MTSLRRFKPQDLLKMNLTNLDPLTENYNIDYYLNYLMRWPELFTVAEDAQGNIVAYMMAKTERHPAHYSFLPAYMPLHGHVTALTVSPTHRRLGLAQSLTSSLERHCDSIGCYFVDLFVRVSNTSAINLYRGMGYKVYRRVVGYYSDDVSGSGDGEDAFDMRKRLSKDKEGKYVRETGGEEVRVSPDEI